MLIEWKYFFSDHNYSEDILNSLIRKKGEGIFLGSTFLKAKTHTCFNENQSLEVEKLISEVCPKLVYQKKNYFRGDLFDYDFNMKTFKNPFVQWCPSPIFSYEAKELIPPEEPWGISMEGFILIRSVLRNVILKYVKGLKIKNINIVSDFDIYEVEELRLSNCIIEANKNPLVLDCSSITERDIFLLNKKIFVLSSRFSSILKKYWDGMIFNKFQPIICENVPPVVKKYNLKKIPIVSNLDHSNDLLKDISSIEKELNISFPKDFIEWVLDNEGFLPNGWLSPIKGFESNLMKTFIQESELAEPTIPSEMIPVYSYGDGNFICLQNSKFVDWDHETAFSQIIDMPHGFSLWVKSFNIP